VQEAVEAQGELQPPLMDPVADLKLNQLEVVEAVRERQSLLQVLWTESLQFQLSLYCPPALEDLLFCPSCSNVSPLQIATQVTCC